MACCSTTCAVPPSVTWCGREIPTPKSKKIGGWKTAAVFHRHTIIDRRMMADAIHKLERYRAEQAARRENGHTLPV